MLVLGRQTGERIYLETSDGPIWITIINTERGRCRLGVEAPRTVIVMREELLSDEQKERSKR
jgi:carbon storage regulator CsrA